MPIEAKPLRRIFLSSGREFPDPDSNMSPDQVRKHYAPAAPDLSTAKVAEPRIEGDLQVFEFVREIGTKA